ncbi:MAG: hypothetical protein IPH22_03755 [Nitrosomonas sp.]|nr:hypothetical protein [Nitrosomonas sp.]
MGWQGGDCPLSGVRWGSVVTRGGWVGLWGVRVSWRSLGCGVGPPRAVGAVFLDFGTRGGRLASSGVSWARHGVLLLECLCRDAPGECNCSRRLAAVRLSDVYHSDVMLMALWMAVLVCAILRYLGG